MNATLVCLLAALSASPADGSPDPVYTSPSAFGLVLRGQTPTFEPLPAQPGTTFTTPPTFSAPGDPYATPAFPPSGGMTPYQPLPQGGYDPFLIQPPGSPMLVGPQVNPYGGSVVGSSVYGSAGPQVQRLGWTQRYEIGYLPEEESTAGEEFEIFELDTEWRYTAPLANGGLFSHAPQFNFRLWDAPSDLPSDLYRFGWDLALSTPAQSPLGIELGFTPSINTDFEQSLTSNAWNFDGRIIGTWRASPFLTLVLGVAYWDRVDDIFVPVAGVIWTPDDRWMVRLVVPNPEISLLLGREGPCCKWVYVRGEYHVESYEIEREVLGIRDQIQMEDYRFLGGFRWDSGVTSAFIEAGLVFERDVELRRGGTFGIDDGFIVRAGLQF